MRPWSGAVAAAMLWAAATLGAAAEPPAALVDAATGARVSFDAFIEAAAKADIVLLGEIHDNPTHHAWQAAIAAALDARVGVVGVALEMITPQDEATANAQRAAGASDAALADALQWSERGWPAFELYAPIFRAAPRARIAGGGVPRAELGPFFAGAAAAADALAADADARRFGFAAPLAVDDQAQREAEQIAAHCDAIPAEVAAPMVAAQRLRDARLAAAALRARGSGGLVVVIAGAGHARKDVGAPAALALGAPELAVVSVGMTEAGGADASDWRRFDYVAAAPPPTPPRPDPCEAFKARG